MFGLRDNTNKVLADGRHLNLSHVVRVPRRHGLLCGKGNHLPILLSTAGANGNSHPFQMEAL